MGSRKHQIQILIALCFALFVLPTQSEIHRARSIQTYKHRFRNADNDVKPGISEWTKWFETKIWGHSRRVWIYSSVSAGLVGLTGLFPLLVIPVNCGAGLKSKASRARLQLLLSFAVGGLLGDVFLHLLPEAWVHVNKKPGDVHGYRVIGGWVLAGLLSFYVIERLFGEKDDDDDDEEEEEEEETKEEAEEVEMKSDNGAGRSSISGEASSGSSDDSFDVEDVHGFAWKIREERLDQRNSMKKIRSKKVKMNDDQKPTNHDGDFLDTVSPLPPPLSPSPQISSSQALDVVSPVAVLPPNKKDHIKVSGWLNLLANVVDNFTHGLAVAGSYSISPKMGVLTTLAILLHEIPHEIGDFAILLQAGFDRWRAAKVQVLTASGGIIGALLALSAESAKILGDSTAWILPFTAGGFINIALIAIVPELLRQSDARNSLKQLFLVCSGIFVMGLVTALVD